MPARCQRSTAIVQSKSQALIIVGIFHHIYIYIMNIKEFHACSFSRILVAGHYHLSYLYLVTGKTNSLGLYLAGVPSTDFTVYAPRVGFHLSEPVLLSHGRLPRSSSPLLDSA